MRGGCELVLVFAGDRVCVVGEHTHGLIREDVVEPVVGEVILERHVAVFEAGPDFSSICGARVIDSWPPATTTSKLPARIN